MNVIFRLCHIQVRQLSFEFFVSTACICSERLLSSDLKNDTYRIHPILLFKVNDRASRRICRRSGVDYNRLFGIVPTFELQWPLRLKERRIKTALWARLGKFRSALESQSNTEYEFSLVLIEILGSQSQITGQ